MRSMPENARRAAREQRTLEIPAWGDAPEPS
jgi:hypothetical protein